MLLTAASLIEKLPRPLRRHRLMTIWMKVTREAPLQLVRIRDDYFGYADMNDGFLRLIVIEQRFEKDFFNLADRVLQRGGAFFDIGANHGLLSFGLAGKYGAAIDFHLFEPNPQLGSSIRKTSILYPAMRLTLVEAAVSDRDGSVPFEINSSHNGASHICPGGAGEGVRSVTLDQYLERAAIDRVDFVKIDIEGYELLALQGARRALEKQVLQAIYFEYCEKWLRRVSAPAELLAYIESAGYEVCFCRADDIMPRGGATHTFIKGLPGHGFPLLPISGQALPNTTDLLAVPRQNLVMAAETHF